MNKYRIKEKDNGNKLYIQKRHGWFFPVWETVSIVFVIERNGHDHYGTITSISESLAWAGNPDGVIVDWGKLGIKTGSFGGSVGGNSNGKTFNLNKKNSNKERFIINKEDDNENN